MRGLRESRARYGFDRGATAGIGAALILSFLTVSLTPCPPSTSMDFAPIAASEPDCHTPPGSMVLTAMVLTAPCPCGCEAHPPVAGSSARLGAALLSEAPQLAQLAAMQRVAIAVPRIQSVFSAPIDHIPLPA